mmetsp:Transcript_34832/g.35386  ORF Transcript_34832/g.35386 Transcript_34832/m.35386 type:complete len:157 (+) Transcript_34832:462-932(+)
MPSRTRSKSNLTQLHRKIRFSTIMAHIGMEKFTQTMICYAIYFNCIFTTADYRAMICLQAPHHNMEIGINILLSKRIMVKSKNDTQQEVFWVVESICQHIRYEEPDNIKQQLKTLLSEGNKKITTRKTKASARKRKRDYKQDKHNKSKKIYPILEV